MKREGEGEEGKKRLANDLILNFKVKGHSLGHFTAATKPLTLASLPLL